MALETQNPAMQAVLEPALRSLTRAAVASCRGVLARVWLTGPGDRCPDCPMRPECPDRARCLHLVASAGLSSRTDGPFGRFPIGAREVGQVPLTRRPFVLRAGLEGLGLAEPWWLARHAVRSFAAWPLDDGRATFGVLAVFAAGDLPPAELDALEHLARLGSLALANARAFAELARARNREAARAARPRTERAGAGLPPDVRTLAEVERDAIERTLEVTGGRVSGARGAARLLGLRPTTLHSRMKKLGVRRRPEA